MSAKKVLGFVALALSAVGLAAPSPKFEVEFFRDSARLQECKLLARKQQVIDALPAEDFPGKSILIESFGKLHCPLNETQQVELESSLLERHRASVSEETPFLLASQAEKRREGAPRPEAELQTSFPANYEKDCPARGSKTALEIDLTSREQIQGLMFRHGFNCVARLYVDKVNSNAANRKAVRVINGDQDKAKPSLKGMRILIVPHFGYERGWMVSEISRKETFLPWLKLAKPNGTFEKFDYLAFRKHLKKLGADAVILHRVSDAPVETQVTSLAADLAREKGSYAIFARSSGAIVVNELIRTRGKPAGFKLWVNLAGTPHGSHVPHSIVYDLVDYVDQSLAKNIEAVKASTKLKILPGLSSFTKSSIAKFAAHSLDLKIADELFLLSNKSKGMPKSAYGDLQVVNYNFFPTQFDSYSRHVKDDMKDLPLAGMMRFGPSEGSSLWADMAIDTKESVRVLQDGDHFFFRDHDAGTAAAIANRIFRVYEELVKDGSFRRVF